jgi:FtsZ-binding cell division protein ZapB
MDRLDILEKKVHEAARQLTELRQERDRLQAELSFLEQEQTRTQDLIRENNTLREEKKQLASRIEKVLKKLNSLNI